MIIEGFKHPQGLSTLSDGDRKDRQEEFGDGLSERSNRVM